MSEGPAAGTVVRFAPSPTGHLHLGHAYSALFAARAAEAERGRLLVRIEDIDSARCRPAFERSILDDLAWLGLVWETPVRRQSEHMADYQTALDRLAQAGLLYPCFCTRKQIHAEIARSPSAPHGPDGPLYPGTCRALRADERAARRAGGEAYALRLDTGRALAQVTGSLDWEDETEGPQRFDAQLFGDVVLARKETPTSYHLAVTVDDALQGVTLVTRGRDLLPATHVHRLLQVLLGLPTPRYRHHKLIADDEGRRLAKRERAATLRDLRAQGLTPAELRRRLGFS